MKVGHWKDQNWKECPALVPRGLGRMESFVFSLWVAWIIFILRKRRDAVFLHLMGVTPSFKVEGLNNGEIKEGNLKFLHFLHLSIPVLLLYLLFLRRKFMIFFLLINLRFLVSSLKLSFLIFCLSSINPFILVTGYIYALFLKVRFLTFMAFIAINVYKRGCGGQLWILFQSLNS